MRTILAAVALVACLPTAHAQDKGKTDFSVNGEFRVRDTFEQNESGNSSVEPSHHNGVDQRLKLGMKFKANEKFSVTATLLQSASWGQNAGDAAVGDRGATSADASNNGDSSNFMAVNEAYGTWMMADDFIAKIGRMNYSFGDGTVMSVNDWQRQPYAFDGVTVNHEMEFGKFTLFAFKYRDFTNSTVQGAPAGTANTTTTSDPQHDAYGLVFDLKTMPEWLKAVNVHIIQDTGDSVWNAGAQNAGQTGPNAQTTLQNLNSLRYGATAGAGWGAFDVNAGYEGVTGKTSVAGAGGAVATDMNITQMMYHAEVGFSLPNLMGSRFYVNYHSDSGTSASDQGKKANTYDPYFYDRHNGSGMMELVGWGNLTAMSAGWTLKPADNTNVGLSYWMFNKTNKDDTINPGYYGQNLFNYAAGAVKSTAIGSEVDLWAEHMYEGGFSTLARLGYFSPGGNLKDSTVNKGSSITQVMIQGKLTF